jgi:predicted exporter
VGINTDLFDLLPASSSLRSAAAADKVLGARTGRGVYILSESRDFGEAREAAIALYGALGDSPAFESLALFVDEALMAQLAAYLHDYRYALLDGETRELLEKGGARTVAGEALAAAFGALTFTGLDSLETDPFLLADRGMRRFLGSALLSGGALSLREDVLAASLGDTWYVLIRGSLSAAGASLTNAESGVEKIYAAAEHIREQNPGAGFVYSGIPFHSYASSSAAQREISLISAVTSLIILVLFLFVFRSILPVTLTLLTIGVSALSAAGTVLLFFREMHVLTFVFGTTLIGMGVDYSVHYFIHRRGSPALESGAAIRGHLRRSILMSLASSCLCFALLLFAPFAILRQFAVFSMAGLLSSFLSVFCLYPLLKNPAPEKRRIPWLKPSSGGTARPLLRGLLIAALLAAALGTLFGSRDKLRVENNLGGLYTMPDYLLESERAASAVLNQGSAGWYFIVSGESPEETLEHEEALTAALDAEIAGGNLSSYMAASLFIPSVRTQQKNYAAAAALLPWAEGQFESLGFPPEAAAAFREDFARARDKQLFPGGDIPPYLADIIANLWIGKAGDAYYSCVLPLHTKGEEPFRAIAEKFDFVFFVNKVEDISRELDSLTWVMILLFAAAYLLIALGLRFFYSPADAARICAIPALVVLVTLAVLAAADIPLSLFSMTGLVLVFGLGLDYMFYMTEDRRSPGRPLTVLAVFLSFATTALSFGALSLSGFAPVHIFGLTVFTGLSAAFVFALLLSGGPARKGRGN